MVRLSKQVGKRALLFFVLILVSIGLLGCDQKKRSLNIDSFFYLERCNIENDFIIERDPLNRELNANVEHDLNKDGKMDTVEAMLLGRNHSALRINELELPIFCENPFDFYLVDLVEDDKFIELAIYDDGPSGDPTTTFYRYDGVKIYELGSFKADIDLKGSIAIYSLNVLTDGKGNLIPPDSIIRFVSPNILKGYYSIENNKFVYNPVDYVKSLADEYVVTDDFEAFFIKRDVISGLSSRDIKFTWDAEEIIEFNKGEKIKIIVIGDFWYGIERQDGTTEILYFWKYE